MKQQFFICEKCGNMIAMVKSSGVPVMCCGQKMTELIPGTSDGAHEKHVPVFTVEGNQVHVKVGEVAHPMLDAHYIEWISLQTKQGNQRKELHPGEAPEACFALCEGDEVEIGFNNRYLLDALRNARTEKVRLEISGPLSPVKVLPAEGNDFLYLVLPVRFKND